MEIHDFLIKRQYKAFVQTALHPYKSQTLFEHTVTKLESQAVCETNNKLCIHVNEYIFKDEIIGGQKNYEVKIIAERKGFWWEINAYSISESELIKKIEDIENTLINLFNAI